MNAPTSIPTGNTGPATTRPNELFSYEDVQSSIEQIYDLRSAVIRIGLMGVLLSRPDPHRDVSDAERRDCMDTLIAETTRLNKATIMLDTTEPFGGIDPGIAKWMSVVANHNAEHMAIARKVNALSQQILDFAQTGDSAISAALYEHRRVARDGFHTAVTDLCLHMWRSYDKDNGKHLARAREAGAALGNRLNRLERIGTHVRLVSLNASVEASHIGDRGRGLSVIAQEFKGLAEEVRQLAQDARLDVNRMQNND